MEHRRSEQRRREAAQAGNYEVEEGGYEVAGRSLSTMLSVRLNSAQLRAIREAAEMRNMTLSSFIRESVMKAAALPYVKMHGLPEFSTYTA